ncbi:hypothetical protein SC377_02365 [Actinotignum sp. SLA_B059]|uniref:hypothetical protein n=1 Tax=Actinotignum sp. SLA_B059 TaxID=3083287 RepID=UPI002A80E73A|nr:hypothetical protein [Actinotignum sp. SLA_B059]MDY5126992.1 hypothetical protein [Actinotignum sp. SLA_B059]
MGSGIGAVTSAVAAPSSAGELPAGFVPADAVADVTAVVVNAPSNECTGRTLRTAKPDDGKTYPSQVGYYTNSVTYCLDQSFVTGDNKISWDAGTKTLWFNSYVQDASNVYKRGVSVDTGGIASDIRVKFSGANVFTASEGGYTANALYFAGNQEGLYKYVLDFDGDASFDATNTINKYPVNVADSDPAAKWLKGGSIGLDSSGAPIEIVGQGKLTAVSRDITCEKCGSGDNNTAMSTAIRSTADLSIGGNVQVTARVTNETGLATGINAWKNLKIDGTQGATVTAEATSNTSTATAIMQAGGGDVDNTGDVMSITNAKVTAQATAQGKSSFGVYSRGNLSVAGKASLDVTSSSQSQGYGVYSEGQVKADGAATLTVAASSANVAGGVVGATGVTFASAGDSLIKMNGAKNAPAIFTAGQRTCRFLGTGGGTAQTIGGYGAYLTCPNTEFGERIGVTKPGTFALAEFSGGAFTVDENLDRNKAAGPAGTSPVSSSARTRFVVNHKGQRAGNWTIGRGYVAQIGTTAQTDSVTGQVTEPGSQHYPDGTVRQHIFTAPQARVGTSAQLSIPAGAESIPAGEESLQAGEKGIPFAWWTVSDLATPTEQLSAEALGQNAQTNPANSALKFAMPAEDLTLTPVYGKIVVPAAPVTAPQPCDGSGTVAPAKVTLPENAVGIIYGEPKITGTTATVTATAKPGYLIATPVSEPGSTPSYTVDKEHRMATWTLDLTSTACAATPLEKPAVTPIAPTLVPADSCGTPATVTIPESAVVEYTRTENNGTVTVTAQLKDPQRYNFAVGATTEWTFDISARPCPVPEPPVNPEPGAPDTPGTPGEPNDPGTPGAPDAPEVPGTPEQKAPAVKVKRPAAKLAHTGTAVTTGIAGAAALILGGYVLRRKYRG